MAALAVTTPTRAGTVSAGAAVAASDTISRTQLGGRGAFLEIINDSASVDNVTVSDPGVTPAGSPLVGGNYAVAVSAGTAKIMVVSPRQVNEATGLVTVTHSQTATVTYKLYPLG